jgi:hypothetical protein
MTGNSFLYAEVASEYKKRETGSAAAHAVVVMRLLRLHRRQDRTAAGLDFQITVADNFETLATRAMRVEFELLSADQLVEWACLRRIVDAC